MTNPIQMPVRPVPADYSADRFENQAISLFELFKASLGATGQMPVRGKTFINCTIEGPAVLLALGGVDFDGCDLGPSNGDPASLILRPVSKKGVTGVIAVENCSFKDCNFFAVGYTGPEAFISRMLEVLEPKSNA